MVILAQGRAVPRRVWLRLQVGDLGVVLISTGGKVGKGGAVQESTGHALGLVVALVEGVDWRERGR